MDPDGKETVSAEGLLAFLSVLVERYIEIPKVVIFLFNNIWRGVSAYAEGGISVSTLILLRMDIRLTVLLS